MAVPSLKIFPSVIIKLANLPISKVPHWVSDFKNLAGLVVKAFKAYSSGSPFSIALRRFGQNFSFFFIPLKVKENSIPFLYKMAGL